MNHYSQIDDKYLDCRVYACLHACNDTCCQIYMCHVLKNDEYHQVVHEIDHMSDSHVDSSFHKQSKKLNNYVQIEEWFDSSLGQTTVIQRLDLRKPTLSNPNQTQNKRRYVNFENGSHFICSLNLNSLELTVFIVFKITDIASGNQEIVNSLIGNSIIDNGKLKINAKHISFYKTHSGGVGLLISKAEIGAYVAIANDSSNLFSKPDSKFTSSKSNCTVLNKWHVISVMWSNKKNLSNCWSNGEKLMTFSSRDAKGSNYSFIGNLSWLNGSYKTYLSGCIGEIIAIYSSLTDEKSSHIHNYLIKSGESNLSLTADPI